MGNTAKIAEVKNGSVRYGRSKVAHTGSAVTGRSGYKDTKQGWEDFTKYLSEQDRRRWNRLPDFKKERILRKAEHPAAELKAVQHSEDIRCLETARFVSVEGLLHHNRNNNHTNHTKVLRLNETANAALITNRAESTSSGPGTRSRKANGRWRRQNDRALPGEKNKKSSFRHQLSEDSPTAIIVPQPAAANRITGQAPPGAPTTLPSFGSGGLVGAAASTAKKTASKVSRALREKADQLSPVDDTQSMERYENASAEVKKVTSPIKKITGAALAILSMILGPMLFVILAVIILVVVIVFLLAWLISILFPAVSAAHGMSSGTGLMPYYCQQDERWGSYPFNGYTISTDGCGMTSMAMIMACLTGDMSIIPPTIVDTGYNTVQSHGAPADIAAVYGITDIEQMGGPSKNDCSVSEYDEAHLLEKIAEGCPVLVSVTGTYLGVSTDGHYFVIYGQGENGVYVYDPATLGRIYQESIEGGGSDWNDTIHDAKHIWIFPAPEIRVEGDTNAEKIFNYLVRAGWSKASAAAAVGNFYQEAGGGGTADINPASYDSGSWGEAGGIAGFTDNGDAGNFTALKDYAASKGKDWTDLQIQCEFLIYQLSHGKWWGAYDTPTYTQMQQQGYSVEHMTYEEFTQLTDVNEAVKAFLCFYEDCGYRMAHYEDVRLPMAQQAYAAWGSETGRSDSNEKK